MSTMTRAAWSELDAVEQRKFIAGGGTLTDPAPPPAPKITDAAVLTRAEFFALTPEQQRAEVRAGRKVVDGDRAAPAAAAGEQS